MVQLLLVLLPHLQWYSSQQRLESSSLAHLVLRSFGPSRTKKSARFFSNCSKNDSPTIVESLPQFVFLAIVLRAPPCSVGRCHIFQTQLLNFLPDSPSNMLWVPSIKKELILCIVGNLEPEADSFYFLRIPRHTLVSSFNKEGNVSFGIVGNLEPEGDSFHFLRIARHTLLVGPKKETSRGWVRCVEFGGRQTNLMLFSQLKDMFAYVWRQIISN